MPKGGWDDPATVEMQVGRVDHLIYAQDLRITELEEKIKELEKTINELKLASC